MSQFAQISTLTLRLALPGELKQAFRALRAGVDYTQNQGDGSLDAETWTAARDAATAFEALERALQRLDGLTIPF